jgi:hypothetical protein
MILQKACLYFTVLYFTTGLLSSQFIPHRLLKEQSLEGQFIELLIDSC